MPSAEIIAIGTELLLGEIQDTNTRFLALRLRDANIDLFRATMVGDNPQRIAQAISEALSRSDIVITTGGLGPTVDDPTRLAVALAVGVDTEFRADLWDQIQNRFQRFNRVATENNKRQAYVPQGAIAVENPVGTAPAFIVEYGSKSIISVPGVPREMEYLIDNRALPYLKERYHILGTIKASVLHTSGVGESQIDEWVGDLETLTNPTVGLLAHPGLIDIRVTAKAASIEEADQMIETLVDQITQRLGDHIFGRDQDTLEKVTHSLLEQAGLKFYAAEFGMTGELTKRIKDMPSLLCPVENQATPLHPDELAEHLREAAVRTGASVCLGASYWPGPEKQTVHIAALTASSMQVVTRAYGGPPQQGLPYAVNTAIDFLRRSLLPSSPTQGALR
jgi:competence/damage-inducible protein CinA-like protein